VRFNSSTAGLGGSIQELIFALLDNKNSQYEEYLPGINTIGDPSNKIYN
jgi:hypothetical protein